MGKGRSGGTPRRVTPTAVGATARPGEDAGAAVLAELARHLVAASQTAQRRDVEPAGPRKGGALMRRDSAEQARARASWERTLRVQAGQQARRLPYLATWAAGWTAWGAAELAAAAAGQVGHTSAIAGTVGLCAAGTGILRITYRHGIAPRWRTRWWTATAAASGWVSVAATVGPGNWPMTAALLTGAAAVAAGWARAHAVPNPHDQPDAGPAPVIDQHSGDDLGEVLAERWAAHIAAKDGVLPGALLTGRTDLPHAIRWMVQTPPGKVAFDQLLAALPRIAAGLRQSQAKVVLEPVADDESAAWLSIINRDVLAEGVPYPGPTYLTDSPGDGRIPIGPYADGTGQADYAAVDNVGCRNGLATGAPGSGKSAFLEAVALGLKASGRWTVLFGDGDPGGGSSPLLNRLADWRAAGPEEALAQLGAVEELLELRAALKGTLTAGPDGHPIPIIDPTRQVPLREMLPSTAFPGVCWILDELHRLTQDDWLKSQDFGGRLEKIARIGRKYGIVLLAGTQSLLADDFGGNTKLRAYLSDRNCFVFRNPNRSEQHTIAGLKLAPSALPPGGGYAFSTGSGRVSMLRVAWARDLSRYLGHLPQVGLDPDSDRVLAAHRPASAGDPTSLYSDAVTALRQMRTRHTHAGPSSAGRPDHQDQPAGDADRPRTGPVRPGLWGVAIPPALTGRNVIPIRPRTEAAAGPVPSTASPGADDSRTTEETSAPGPARPVSRVAGAAEGLNDTQRCVYDALNSLGWRQLVRTGQLADLTGLRPPAVSKALAVLAERGLAVRLAHGEWQSSAVATHASVATTAEAGVSEASERPEEAG
jgi:hypothetical protein